MKTRKDAIDFCLTLKGAYEDYPFSDHNWTIMRHRQGNRMFAAIYERMGNIWLNLKCDPELSQMWRMGFESVIPAYHMNKYHWNSVILDGSIPVETVMDMIEDSYELTKPKNKKKQSKKD